jgi:dolichol-phosphate mannosyltransferase
MGQMVSIVVATVNEEEHLRPMYEHLISTMQAIGISFEIIFVDDRGHDASWEIIEGLHKKDSRVKGIKLSRNFGHQAAVTSGLDHARGDVVITMEGDLHHPTELIPQMIERWRQGYAVVSTVRETPYRIGWFKRWAAALFFRFINSVSDIRVDEDLVDFRLLDRKALNYLNAMRERSRFVRGLISWVGFNQTELRYTTQPRPADEAKCSLRKMMHSALSAVFSFSTLPLKVSFYIGLLINLLCLPLMLWALYTRFISHTTLPGWTSTFIALLLLNGLQLIMLGIIGAYLGRVFEEAKKRPLYVTQQTIGLEAASADENRR